MSTALDIIIYALAGVGAFCLLMLVVLYAAFRLLRAAVRRAAVEQAKANDRMDALIKQHMGDIETTTPDKAN